jgi:hypothetical protein
MSELEDKLEKDETQERELDNQFRRFSLLHMGFQKEQMEKMKGRKLSEKDYQGHSPELKDVLSLSLFYPPKDNQVPIKEGGRRGGRGKRNRWGGKEREERSMFKH